MNNAHHLSIGRRLFSLLLAALLLPVFALAEPTGAPLVITLTWTGEDGAPVTAQANAVKMEGYPGAYWLYVPSEALTAQAALSISDVYGMFPGGFTLPDGQMLQDLPYTDAGTGLNETPVAFQGLNAEGAPAADFFLYISTAAEAPLPPQNDVSPAEITVHYLNRADETPVAGETMVTVPAGGTETIYAKPVENFTPEMAEQTVSVDEQGTPSMAEAVFYYNQNAEPVEPAVISVRYLNRATMEDVHEAENASVAPGETRIFYAQTVENFTPEMTEQTVSVDEHGTPSLNEVVFYYNQNAAPAEPAKVPVRYLNQATGQALLDETELIVQPGTTETAYAQPVENFTPTISEQSVSADEHGVPMPAEINFFYTQILAEPTHITVLYIDRDTGLNVASVQQISAPAGQTTPVYAQPADLLPGYELADGIDMQEVSVSQTGEAAPAEIVFTYVKLPAPMLTIQYLDAGSREAVASPQKIDLVEGINPVKADPKDLTEGYALQEGAADTQYVTVTDNVADVETVAFLYAHTDVPATEPPAAPKVALVPVYYRDQFGKLLVDPAESVSCMEGEITSVKADISRVDANLYELTSAAEMQVSVSADGVATPGEVVFLFRDLSVGRTAAITVRYLEDGTGTPLYPEETIEVGADGKTLMPHPAPETHEAGHPESVAVTLSQTGEPSQDTVVFTYVKKPEATEIPATEAPTAIPDGVPVNRWGNTTSKVFFRRDPSTKNKAVTEIASGKPIWILQKQTVKDKAWYAAVYNGKEGFIMAEFVSLMTKEDSDAMQASLASPAPARTLPPIPGATDEPAPVTETPVPATPSPTEEPPQYRGYAITMSQAALRTGISMKDDFILATLPQNSIVTITGQTNAGGEVWDLVEALQLKLSGYIPDSALRHIGQQEAQPYLNQLSQQEQPVKTAAPALPQQQGYALTLGNNVPMRTYFDSNAQILNILNDSEVVQVLGQEHGSDENWHLVRYKTSYGFIRQDQLRMMNELETQGYLSAIRVTPVPPPVPTATLSAGSLSSYGYVNSNKVRLRKEPSLQSAYLKMMDKNAFALVLGSVMDEGGASWYRINQAGTEGYVKSDYFTVLPMNQLTAFLQSSEYLNANSSAPATGGNPAAQITPIEDFNNVVWKNPSLAQASYEPFNPVASPTPYVEAIVTPSPTPAPSASPDAMPAPTVSLSPLATDAPKAKSSSFPGGLVAALLLAALGGGGYYAYYMYRENQKRRAARIAKRRQMQQQAAQQPQTVRPQNAAPYSPAPSGQQAYRPGAQENSAYRPQGTQQYKPAAPTQGTQQFRPAAPAQGTEQFKPAAPAQGTQQFRPAYPAQGTQQFRHAAPTQGTQQFRPAAPTQGAQQYKPAAPARDATPASSEGTEAQNSGAPSADSGNARRRRSDRYKQ